jgi:ribonuclease Z
MSRREMVALGTSSQVPTRERSHNACILLWDGVGYLFDPGEGAQRQMTLAGVSAGSIHHICISHFHGDHCLGLAGIVQRLSLENCRHPVHLYYPESGRVYVENLCRASIYQPQVELVYHPIPVLQDRVELNRSGESILEAISLVHSVPVIGFRVSDLPRAGFIPEKLEAFGIRGPAVGELKRKGTIVTEGRLVDLEEVTVTRVGSAFAYVMDTRPCAAAEELAREADLLLMEATYTSEHVDLAAKYGHSTAEDAARTALNAGARKLALTHFSQRYADPLKHLAEAGRIFPNVIALSDLDRVVIHGARRGDDIGQRPPKGPSA